MSTYIFFETLLQKVLFLLAQLLFYDTKSKLQGPLRPAQYGRIFALRRPLRSFTHLF
jgi:hypothetical protein